MKNVNCKIRDIDEFGGAVPDLTPSELAELGFELGDTIDFHFSNGTILENVPYYNGYYTELGVPVLVAYPGYTYPTINLNGGSFTDQSGVRSGDSVTITMHEKGGKKDVMDLRGVVYSNDPQDYRTLDQFANARLFCPGKIAPGKLYRCASPFDRIMNRPDAVSAFLENNSVRSTLSLSESDNTLKLSYADMPSYSKKIYESGCAVPLRMGADYFSEAFREKLVSGLCRIMEKPLPWAIHCLEGKDRTGFVCVLLGAFMDAGYQELVDDFMVTYDNYYGITEASDPFRYNGFRNTFVEKYLCIFREADPDGQSFRKGAEDYLRSGGMSDAQMEKLRDLIS